MQRIVNLCTILCLKWSIPVKNTTLSPNFTATDYNQDNSSTSYYIKENGAHVDCTPARKTFISKRREHLFVFLPFISHYNLSTRSRVKCSV